MSVDFHQFSADDMRKLAAECRRIWRRTGDPRFRRWASEIRHGNFSAEKFRALGVKAEDFEAGDPRRGKYEQSKEQR